MGRLRQLVIAESERLRLRYATPNDLAFVLNTERDLENSRFVAQWTEEQHLSAMDDPDLIHLIVELLPDGSPVGYLIAAGLASPHQSIELKRIALAVREQGIGKEALRVLLDWAFREREAHRVWLDVKDFKTRARHVYASLGFVEEGTLRECLRAVDRYESLVVMSMLKREYEQRYGS